jgi:hypothetical protein
MDLQGHASRDKEVLRSCADSPVSLGYMALYADFGDKEHVFSPVRPMLRCNCPAMSRYSLIQDSSDGSSTSSQTRCSLSLPLNGP